ncbi:MAG: HD domain-containing protein [Fimbriimonadaceae bacterium]|nr:HD domain-containing protein [Fimbriimonadaceae bacterium]
MVFQPSKAGILAALSLALDLVEGQPEGHSIRSCGIAQKIADQLGLSEQQHEDLYYAALLKDSGCSNNSVRIHKVFGGDEILVKRGVKFVDWSSPLESVKYGISVTEIGNTLGAKLRRVAANIGPPNKVMHEVTQARCTRGAAIAKKLGFSNEVASAIHGLDEHWDGKGSPFGVKGTEIPLLARILCIAQTMEVFVVAFGVNETYGMLRKRKGKWFDPELVSACESFENDTEFWGNLLSLDHKSIEPKWLDSKALDADIDAICEAFAMIIDAKSAFTAEHSTRVAEYAVSLGRHMSLPAEELILLKRAGLMHDIGKLAVSSGILEKPGKLDDQEFAAIKSHPKHSFQILNRISSFEDIAQIASAHHERLDGRGYWQGLSGDQLSLHVRLMTVSDVFDALTANRPYRDAMPLDKVFAIMDSDIGSAFCPDCVRALHEVFGSSQTLAA